MIQVAPAHFTMKFQGDNIKPIEHLLEKYPQDALQELLDLVKRNSELNLTIVVAVNPTKISNPEAKRPCVFETFTHEQFLDRTKEDSTLTYSDNKNKTIRIWTRTPRLRQLRKSQVCAHCGVKGTVWRVEKFPKEKQNHRSLNLYSDCGKMLTWDHVIPRSRGGNSSEENSQTLCSKCNQKKGNSLESELRWRNCAIVRYEPIAMAIVRWEENSGTRQDKALTHSVIAC